MPIGWLYWNHMWDMLCISASQVAVKSLVVSFYRSMKRPKAIYWSARTARWRRWYKRAARRNTAPESAWSWRKNSAAGESQFSEVFKFLRSGILPSMCLLVFTYSRCLSFGHLSSTSLVLLAGLSAFKGTTGNATCFLLTVSPTVCRSRPTSTSLCMKRKVNVPVSEGFCAFIEFTQTSCLW